MKKIIVCMLTFLLITGCKNKEQEKVYMEVLEPQIIDNLKINYSKVYEENEEKKVYIVIENISTEKYNLGDLIIIFKLSNDEISINIDLSKYNDFFLEKGQIYLLNEIIPENIDISKIDNISIATK